MQLEIQRAAEPLVGKALWKCTRASDMACFQFGQRRTVQKARGNTAEVGEYALHLQCPWRIVRDDEIVAAGLDVYKPKIGHEGEDGPGFDWEHAGNLLEQRIETFFESGAREYRVEAVQVGRAGAIFMALQGGSSLEVIPCDSTKGEHWRLFEPNLNKPHFVVAGAGIGEPDE